jgi:Rrf2 family nitric oxide-sensitive transcriptional repressor
MRLTVFTDYSLRVLLVLASRTEELVTISDIAAAFDISHAHLMKVTHVLGKTGWVDTVRGRNGGMRLAADPRKLKLGDVVRRLEEDFALVECMGETDRCVLTGGCGLEVALGLAMENFFRDLNRYSLADLVDTSPALSALALWQPITWPSTSAKSSIPMRRAQK